MRKILLSLIAITTICTNVWGADAETDTYIWKETPKQLTIKASGFANGVISNYSTSNQPWNGKLSTVEEIVVEEGITTIGNNAFYDASRLKTIHLPKTIRIIRNDVFRGSSDNIYGATVNFYFAGSANEWAGVSIASRFSHPLQTTGFFYFNGVQTTRLVLLPPLTEVKKNTFYHGTFSDINIPGTVRYIRDTAFYATWTSGSGRFISIRRKTAPSIGSAALPSTKKTLYYPKGATGYTTPFSGWTTTQCDTSGVVDGVNWSLDSLGVLTLSGSGALTTSFRIADGDDQYPYYYFRFLVDKVVVTGGVTALSNFLQRTQAMRTIEFQQNNIPSTTTTTPTDYVYAAGTLKMVFPCAAVEEVNPTTWSIYKRQLSNTPTISDSEDQTSLIEALHDNLTEPFNLQLNRSLTNAQYNTFCSPIALTAEQLNDADIRALESSSLDGDVLTLTFSSSSLDNIVAGQPYLVKPSSELANPTFTNIAPNSLVSTTTNTETDFVNFIGVLAPTPLTGGNKNTLFLGAGNELFWPEADGNIGGMRAYFSVIGDAQKNGIKARIVMNKEVATDIESISDEGLPVTGKKILRNGQPFIIRDGKEYNVMGIMMK